MLNDCALVLETMDRVQRCFDERPDVFAAIIPASALRHFSACRVRMHEYAVDQEASGRAVLIDTRTKHELRDRVLDLMRRIQLCARARARTSPDLLDIARGKLDRRFGFVVQSAHGLAQAATKYRQEFIDGGLRPNFIEELEKAANALEHAIAEKGNRMATRMGATAGLQREAVNGRRELELIGSYIRERSLDPSLVEVWAAVSRIEPRRQRRLGAGGRSRAIGGATPLRALAAGPQSDESPTGESRDKPSAGHASPTPP